MNLNDLRAKRDQILALAAQHGAGNVRVFGSVMVKLSSNNNYEFMGAFFAQVIMCFSRVSSFGFSAR